MRRPHVFPNLMLVLIMFVPALCRAQKTSSGTLRKLLPPFESVRDAKRFNALRLGSGNTVRIVSTPPNFVLNTFAISEDGRLLVMGWASKRIELRDLQTRQIISEFKSPVGPALELLFNTAANQIIVVGSHGRIIFLSVPSGRELRRWMIPLGPYKYDIQAVVLDPQEKWLAYADGENSKVLDITGNRPRVIADLQDAADLSLSQDGSELWSVSRKTLRSFSTSTWKEDNFFSLKGAPDSTSPVAVAAGVAPGIGPSVAVPSVRGLTIYRGPQMAGIFATDRPSFNVVFARASGTYLDLSDDLTFLSAKGKVLCKISWEGSHGDAVSGDGRWLALGRFDGVDIWRMQDLLRGCSQP